ncbi:MAG: extracellular solute-binding protein [Pseudomonadales bacterium]
MRAVLTVAICVVAGCSERPSDTTDAQAIVNFYNWFDYIHPDTLPAFTRETGIRVNYDVFDSDATLEGKLLAGNSGYDLVVPTYTNFARERAAGVFQPVQWNRLKHAAGLDPYLVAKLAEGDPGNRFGVLHSWGTTGLGFDVDRIRARMSDAPLDSWSLLFDPAIASRFSDCGIALLDSPQDVLPHALLYLGRDPNSESERDLEDAMAVIAGIRPFVRYFHQSQFVDDLANGELCLVLAWSGSVFQALHRSAGRNLRYVVPREGGVIWFVVMAIPNDAPHVDNAYRLIDYLLRPQVAADFTDAAFYPSGVAAAEALVAESVRAEEAIYPSPDVRERLHAIHPETPEYQRHRLRLWTAMKAGGTAD